MTVAGMPGLWENGRQRDRRTVAGPTASSHPSSVHERGLWLIMPVSKRLRYEILKRDNHTCRYCGAAAPEATIRIDHVTPVSLGGTDDPSNLVAACHDCNAGKTSSNPAAPLVADVAQDAIRWAAAMQEAGEVMAVEREKFYEYGQAFEKIWAPRYIPSDGANAIESMYRAGLPIDELRDAAWIALGARSVDNRFSYFCGVAWRKVRKMQEIARGLVEMNGGD
jgi:hypothetical protein